MFDIYKEELRLDEKKIEVPLLKTLVGKMTKDESLKVCLFIFLAYNRSDDNPLTDLSESERVQEAGLMYMVLRQ